MEATKNLVELDFLPVISYALYQNHVPVIRTLQLTNNTEKDWQSVKIQIVPADDFAEILHLHFDSIAAGTSFQAETIQFKIKPAFLSSLTEKMSSSFLLTVHIDNDEEIFRQEYDIDLLAYDQWLGANILPEMLSAFVMPNIPELVPIQKSAAQILEKWTGSSALDAYQSQNADRVKKQMAAVYAAISEQKITYCTVPASFGGAGQRVRLSDTVLSTRMGNCLDMSLLYASCLEAIGLHPLLVLIEGHAFVGAWLIDDTFPDAVNDDPSLLTKRMVNGINEIILVEATAMNEGSTAAFDDAMQLAKNHLNDLQKFQFFIDVHRSRFSGILPFPAKRKTDTGWFFEENTNNNAQSEISNPFALDNTVRLAHSDDIKFGKQQLWERKLLDLSLRNNLLNLRITKSSLQLIPVSPNTLEDAMANGDEFQILSKPKDWDNPLRSAGIYQTLNNQDPMSQLVEQELKQKRLRVYLNEDELNNTLTNLYRSARQAMEENGANTLYLAIGLLRWYETPSSEKPRFAPILLIPVELIRKSVKIGFVVRSREEDTVLNITLLEKLRQDFGLSLSGLDNLPKDESGVDVKMIFNIIRQAVMSLSRWDVEEQIFLGTFSFSKFIMWNDIHSNAVKMKENPIVSGLVNGQLAAPLPYAPDVVLDERFGCEDILLPINADSSQMQAISAATADSSFILHGPPGTGKSQTITNIIANALYQGKRVLFVAEKMAALSVVQNRLETIGLGPFCLQLHSNKAKKSDVLTQLQKTTEIIKQRTPENFQSEADRLNGLRNTLNQYVKALHQKHLSGYSLHGLLHEYIRCGTAYDKLSFSADFLTKIDNAQLIHKMDIAEQLQTMATLCGDASNKNPLYEIQLNQYSSELKERIANALQQFIQTREKLTQTLTQITPTIQYAPSQWNDEQLKKFSSLVEKILQTETIPAAFYNVEKLDPLSEKLLPIIAIGEKRDQLKNELLASFQTSILEAPASELLGQWNVANTQWFLPKYFKQKKIHKTLLAYLKGGTLNKNEIPTVLLNIITYQESNTTIETHTDFLKNILEQNWQNGNPDWRNISESLEIIKSLDLFLHNWSGAATLAFGMRMQIGKLFDRGRSYFLENEGKAFAQLSQLIQLEASSRQQAETLLNVNLTFTINNGEDKNLNKAQQWLRHMDDLRDWFNWTQVRKTALAENLQTLIDAYATGTIATTDILSSFRKSLFRSLAENIIESDPQLIAFNGQYFEALIQKFRELTDDFTKITQAELFAKMASFVPAFSQGAVATSEAGILQKAIKSNGRGVSIRQLFHNIPNLLPRLSPCMLMSPISVAQYLDIQNEPFDLILFDEASQMPTCEAVGTIARGKNLIVVGDPKQMPPTSFFSSVRVDEEDSSEDLESILDDCHALSVPSRQLSWHYRSQHESLIAFSNMKYYDGSLFTFPSPDDLETRVHFIAVGGAYDRGKTRQNRAEAEAIVLEIVRLLSLPEKERKSIGVVTFSSVQQTLIEDLLNEAFVKNPSLEEINNKLSEPLFIKNLENVQGDERDIILFSICYGPDNTGHVALNFGPLNREGGWRRLNVAVSRARYLMKVYSTLRADQIDLSRTRSEGVAGLKAFLAFAEKGKSALPVQNTNTGGIDKKERHALEASIADALRQKGYKVDANIGCSGYRVDMGIVNPEKQSEYLLGILFDGHNYEMAGSARDRNIMQTAVLKQLGWKICRIWTLDWWLNKEKVMQDLLAYIGQINLSKTEQRKQENATPKAPEPIVVSPKEKSNTAHFQTEENVSAYNKMASAIPDKCIEISTIHSPYPIYPLAQLPIVQNGNSDFFLSYESSATIRQQIQQTIDTEAPINHSLLCRRILAAWGIGRLGTRIQSRFDQVFLQIKFPTTKDSGNVVTYWKEEQNPETFDTFRLPANDNERRNAEDIPAIEISNAIVAILSNQISMPESDLVKESAKLLQYGRVGGNVEAAMKKGIDEAVRRQKVKRENERVIFVRN